MGKLIDYVEINPKRTFSRGVSYPFIEMKDLVPNNKFVISSHQKTYAGSGSKFQKGDTLLARITPCLENGKTSQFISDKFEEGFGSSEFIILREKKGKSLNDYIYYLSITQEFREYAIQNMIGTSGRQRVPNEVLASFEHSFPSIKIQEKIVTILNALDNKIVHNTKTQQTLEGIGNSIFKSWFIDFDPVIAKAEGRSTNLPNEISDSFPDSFEHSELGKIPKGWKVFSLSELLDSISDTYPKKEYEKLIFLNTGDIQRGNFLTSEYISTKKLPAQAKKKIKKGDILFSEVRPINNRHAYVDFESHEYIVSNRLLVLRSVIRKNSLFEYYLITQKSSITHLQLLAESRSGTFPQMTFAELSQIKFALPENPFLINYFCDYFLEIIFEKELTLKKEIKLLEELRNTLIPKLISGKIRIPDAEKIVEGTRI